MENVILQYTVFLASQLLGSFSLWICYSVLYVLQIHKQLPIVTILMILVLIFTKPFFHG